MSEGSILLQLQDADLEIRRSQRQLEELPVKKRILEVRRKAKEIEALKGKAEGLVRRLEREVSKNEDETAQVAEKLEAEQAKVMSGRITNPKEVQAITREMDALRRRKDKLEMEDLDLMERVEKARLQVGKVEVAIQQIASQEASLTDEYRAAGGELQSAIEALTAGRTELAESLSADLLGRYEALRETKAGMGAATLVGTACTACRVELPSQRLEELKERGGIVVCPACHRLLVIPLDVDDAENLEES